MPFRKRLGKDRLLPELKLMKTSLRICLADLALRFSRDCLFILAASPSLTVVSGCEEGSSKYWFSKFEPWYRLQLLPRNVPVLHQVIGS